MLSLPVRNHNRSWPFNRILVDINGFQRLAWLWAALQLQTGAQGQVPQISLETFSTGYFQPVDIAHCGDSRLFIVQKNGYIFICDSAGNKQSTPFLNISKKISTGGEQGLLGLAFDPNYTQTRRFYIFYTKKGGQNDLIIARCLTDSLNPNVADTNTLEIILSIPHPNYTNHNGGCIKFGPDGYLYIATGDGGGGGDPDENGQNLNKLLGKMLRIDVSTDTGYAIPPDNPFANGGGKPEIWAYGLRNPWRFSFDRLSGDVWIGDVGQGQWEEINRVAAPDTGGQNYGWDCYEGNAPYETAGCPSAASMTFPVYQYFHSGGDCSVNGGFVYRGGRYGKLFGKYFFSDYCSGKFRMLEWNGNSYVATLLADFNNFNYVSFGEDRNGELYVTDLSNGTIYRLADTSCAPTAVIQEEFFSQTDSICGITTLHALAFTGFSYQWFLNGQPLAGATQPSLTINQEGAYAVEVKSPYTTCSALSSAIYAEAPVQPVILMPADTVCLQHPAVDLTAIPSGGSFLINGQPATMFDPTSVGVGTHTVTYNYVTPLGCTATTEKEIVVEACLQMSEVESSSLHIYPNPASHYISIRWPQHWAPSEVCVIDPSGMRRLVLPSNGCCERRLDFTGWPEGLYVLRIKGEDQVITQKIIIKH
ncbi:MAG: PQQ-dependent sugar dehydrogenase [Chitinophagales bacterium]|nr:PQQ-dependent sugar dehydrogenase [Chitinophagales bacterium]MDW8427222.1 PQQ-dependent sugar dehydrogenase [Chitinophagales bacterium]